jgi:WD40 repeat protein
MLALTALLGTGNFTRSARAQQATLLSVAGKEIEQLRFHPDGDTIVTTSADKKIRIWDLSTGKIFQEIIAPTRVDRLALSPDGKLIAASLIRKGKRPQIGLWEYSTGNQQKLFEGHEPKSEIKALEFSPDGKSIASTAEGPKDEPVKLWDLATGQSRDVFRQQDNSSNALAFSPDGKLLACSATVRGVVLASLDGSAAPDLRKQGLTIYCLAFSPDGKLLAAGGNSQEPPDQTPPGGTGVVRVWDTATWQVRHTLRCGQGIVWAVAFSPDGQTLASSFEQFSIRFWNTTSGAPVVTFDNTSVLDSGNIGSGSFETGGFSPDGKTFAAGNAAVDNQKAAINLWSVSALLKP